MTSNNSALNLISNTKLPVICTQALSTTFTAAVYVGDECIPLISGLSHRVALSYAENFANNSELAISEIAVIRD